jgi:hypothetical protein
MESNGQLYRDLRKGPLLVAEVRGFKSEIGKKFDKSNKDAPPITFGVFKVHLELLADGSPIMLSIYPDASIQLESFGETLGLKRGVLVAISVGRLELKDGQRKAVCAPNAIRLVDPEETKILLAA